jgi:hypothetical protein
MESRAPTPEPGALPDPERTFTPQALLDILDSPNVDEQDMDTINDRAGGFHGEDRGRAEQVVSTSVFRDWIVHRGSSRLLVHGDYDINDYPEISPLSVLCVTLVQALRTRLGFGSLIFFCGRHLGQRHGENTGASGLLRSFIAQLLRQCPSACHDTLNPSISPSEIENGDLKHLTKLFAALVHQLPNTTTLVVTIDGVLVYERKRYREGLYEVVDMLAKLDEEEELTRSPIKILLTSPTETRTRELRETFSKQNAILSMRSRQDTGQGPSRSGVTRKIKELGDVSEEGKDL